MKLRFNILLISATFLVLFSCATGSKDKMDAEKNNETVSLKQFDWLIGDWQNITDEFEFYESWEKNGNNLFKGESFMTIEGDTVFSEFVDLELDKGEIFYRVSVSDQNDGTAVSFKLVSSEDQKFVFTNPEHDYPQTIVYRYVAPDSLYAHIEGNLDGKYRREDFVMVRR
jgi:hypothetical protein